MISSINWCWFKSMYACTTIQYCFHYITFALPGKDSSPWTIPHTYYWTLYVLPDITKGLASLLGWLPHATTETLQAEAPVPYQYSSSGLLPDILVTCCLPSPTSSIARQAHDPWAAMTLRPMAGKREAAGGSVYPQELFCSWSCTETPSLCLYQGEKEDNHEWCIRWMPWDIHGAGRPSC